MIYHGDCLDVLKTLAEASIDACVTDPPYELGFMGKAWDASGVAFQVETWQAVLRVLKPGAHLLAFGGTRTYHRMTCAIEDAGFEIRDSLHWMYGNGFPKSLDVSKAIDKEAGEKRERIRGVRSGVVADTYAQDAWSREFKDSVLSPVPMTQPAQQWAGWGTALKPGHEPIVMARKPLLGTVAKNVQRFGTGAINVDACRIDAGGETWHREPGSIRPNDSIGTFQTGTRSMVQNALGRWPTNVLLDEGAASELDARSGDRPTGKGAGASLGKSEGVNDGWRREAHQNYEARPDAGYGDSGGASRFFYVAKASRDERDMGCYDLTPRQRDEGRKEGNPGGDNPRNRGVQRRGNFHPTVKPVELMRWLVRLVTPPDGTVIDPFTGSGTTGMACAYELRKFIGIEREADYIAIAERRIASVAPLFTSDGDAA